MGPWHRLTVAFKRVSSPPPLWRASLSRAHTARSQSRTQLPIVANSNVMTGLIQRGGVWRPGVGARRGVHRVSGLPDDVMPPLHCIRLHRQNAPRLNYQTAHANHKWSAAASSIALIDFLFQCAIWNLQEKCRFLDVIFLFIHYHFFTRKRTFKFDFSELKASQKKRNICFREFLFRVWN